MSANTPAIEVRGLWKRYGLPVPRLLQGIGRVVTRKGERTDTLPWALQDINFTVERGENLGVIGRNGAGKSTLLKLLAGVSPVTRGEVKVNGRVFPMIELQAGMSMDLTGRENIMLLGAVMGLSPREMHGHYDAIAEFSELGDWLERPVRMYSSGMQARLGVSVAANVDADILLIDEVLSVGDVAFRKKCMESFERYRNSQDKTLVFVSHNPYQVERVCDRVLLLDGGRQATIDDSASAVRLYFGSMAFSGDAETSGNALGFPPAEQRDGTGAVRVSRIELLSGEGEPVSGLTTGQPATMRFSYAVDQPLSSLSLRVRVLDNDMTYLSTFALDLTGGELDAFTRRGYADLTIASVPFYEGEYSLQVRVTAPVQADFIQSTTAFRIDTPADMKRSSGGKGLFYCPADWS